MKPYHKFVAFAAAMVAVVSLQAQTQRTVLIEQQTSASCPNCANQNPDFDELIQDNDGKVVVIKYQRGSYPVGSGYYTDPMFNFTAEQVIARVANYYDNNSFPQVWIDGVYSSVPSRVDQSDIDDASAVAPGFEISVSDEQKTAGDSVVLEISGSLKALEDYDTETDDLRYFVAVIERTVSYDQPPGKNTEKVFHYVMRDMLAGATGTAISADGAMEDSMTTFELTYAVNTEVIDPAQLDVVVFVQEYNSGDVLQAAGTGSVVTSVEDETPETVSDLAVYPTVADDELNVRLQATRRAQLTYTIINTVGQTVHTETDEAATVGTNGYSIDLTDLPNGTYVLQVTDGASLQTTKFHIQR